MFSFFNFFEKKKATSGKPIKLSRQELRERKLERLQRRELRWRVLRHYTMLIELSQATDFYQIKEIANDWAETANTGGDVPDYLLTEHDFYVLKRFVRLKRYKGLCDRSVIPAPPLMDYQSSRTLNLEPHLYRMYSDFESYWDEVLVNYKRPSSNKRLEYLIETLNNQLTDPITNIPRIQQRIKDLIAKYQRM